MSSDTASESDLERVTDLDTLREQGRAVTTAGGHSIALFHHDEIGRAHV